MAAGTRRSARLSSSQQSQDSSPPASQTSPAAAGKKRKAETGSSPSAKRGKKEAKQQKTIEEAMDLDKAEPSSAKAEENEGEEESKPQQDAKKTEKENGATNEKQVEPRHEETNGHSLEQKETEDDKQEEEFKEPEDTPTESKKGENLPAADGDAVNESARDGDVPSSILEKGVMYFFYRGRVNIDSPDSVTDIQRSFIVLRPLPHGAKLGDGPIGSSSKDCRLIAIPKKTLPTSGKDRWTAFVETANTSFPELKESFLKEDKYTTQTQGTQKTPAATPAAEGIYAITSTGRESHLAYIITLPSELGEIQQDLGIRQQGSFILSTKNPKAPGPANADLGRDPGYSQEIQDEFRNLRWMPLQPKHLNYEACQFLMIGEGEQGLDKATEPQEKDIKKDKSAPKDEMEKLEEEDEIRVQHLNGEDAVFKDLGVDSKSYPGLQTTW
ncbi:hypothetical protein H2198_005282 [Neophaeococcomyces mojaviensis]|uniref:Uncharacterized protein n=1 Tax=Neophaeococcomyces mojaviensis TaxID=3383035 RepID=A0ACC3A638_9EURO|nr:hypothetical protein H2198_005282 [Knufia sp. JES_112]